MPAQPYESLANAGAPWQTASGPTLSTAATATLSPGGSGGTGADPQVYSFYQGQLIRIRARCIYTVGSTATNVTFALYASASGTALSGGTSLATTGAMAAPVSVTGLLVKIDAYIQIRAFAQGTSTATAYTHGEVSVQTAVASGTTSNVQIWPLPATSGPTAASLDVSLTHTIGLVGTLSQAVGSPTVTCTQFLAELVAG
jgi:hypothetical protein